MARRIGTVVATGALAVLAACGSSKPAVSATGPVEATIVADGATFKVSNGDVYRVDGGNWTFVDHLYDANYLAQNYRHAADGWYRIDPSSGRAYKTMDEINEGFEGIGSIRDLIGPKRGWTTFTLQSPRTPTVASYNLLRDKIMAGQSGFLDNQIAITNQRVHSGASSFCALSVAPSGSMQTAKSSLETTLLHAAQGDTVDLSGWYYLERGIPVGILDLEASYILNGPGLRVLLDDAGHPRIELKWATKPSWNASSAITLPAKKWVQVRMVAKLDSGTNGSVALYVDGKQVVSGRGQTLPLPSAVYDRLEIAITGDSQPNTTLCVDDVVAKVAH